MGAMHFGERDDILKKAEARLVQVKKEFPKAQLVDAPYVNVVFLVLDAPALYHDHAVACAPEALTRQQWLAQLSRPFKSMLHG